MKLLCIDPGQNESAIVVLESRGGKVLRHEKSANDIILKTVAASGCDKLVIEMVQGYGRPVGEETFRTCVWIGRFIQAWVPRGFVEVKRGRVKEVLCESTKGVNDAVIRQRLIDIYGPGKEKAIGLKKTPGPLYGVKADEWQALAVGVAYLKSEKLVFFV